MKNKINSLTYGGKYDTITLGTRYVNNREIKKEI